MTNSEDFHQLPLADVPKHVRAELADFLKDREPQIAKIGKPVTEAIEHLERFILDGGKRIRPLYAWAGFVAADGLLGDEDPQAVLRAASSLEFIQSCALIHDDIVDASDTRRGNPTVHRAVEAKHRELGWTGSSEDFGRAAAILIGDMSLVWAEDMFLDSGISQAAIQRAREPWREMRTEVIGGQLLDVSLEAAAIESVELSDSVNRFKTAAYTIERPLHLGAAIAGAPQSLVEAFRGYGRDIGVAFQLRDDQLGVFGDPKITGKPSGDDLREGKRTVLMAIALQRADEQDPAAAQFLRENLGTTADPVVLSKMAQLIEDSGAPAEIEKRIDDLTQSGLAHLAKANVNSDVTELLRSLAIKSTARAK